MTVCKFWFTTSVAFCVATLQFDFLGVFTKLQQVTASSSLSVCLSNPYAWNKLTPTGWIFVKFDFSGFNLWKNFQVSFKSDRIMGT